ncbi:molecular chaperone [Eggerthella guodeyinii]|uniref:Molecular chaperone TorD n=1 Tax=Eggerthella guodeyinii TaxID=2690837 RepID=A0A6N7RLD5_9ACTN|nr:molecular chaperone TorD family protein [Eggerthella guodeyinii]MRX81842.1 molecular chaperone TorD [Eggerthella guodeyinii]
MTTEAISAELAENLIEFCENRGRVYALLSRCYETEVDAAFAGELAGEASLDSDDPALAEGFSRLRADLAGCDEDGLERLAVVFDRAFFGMGPRTAQKAFPYESVYTSEGGLMMQDAYSEVLRVYRGAGFAKDPGFKEPEDHLAVELAFMALLCGRAVEALRAGDEDGAERQLRAQLSFAREHLLNWIERFAADVRKAAEGGFYFHLATFTEAYLRADAAALTDVVE